MGEERSGLSKLVAMVPHARDVSAICAGPTCARLILETDEYRSFLDRLSFGHDRICRKIVIRPAQRDALHDDLIVGYSRVLTRTAE
jgi:hypothetical protein